MQLEDLPELLLRIYIQTGSNYHIPGRGSRSGKPRIPAIVRLLAQVVTHTDQGWQPCDEFECSLSPSFKVGLVWSRPLVIECVQPQGSSPCRLNTLPQGPSLQQNPCGL